jgi:hypothetical protein
LKFFGINLERKVPARRGYKARIAPDLKTYPLKSLTRSRGNSGELSRINTGNNLQQDAGLNLVLFILCFKERSLSDEPNI